MKFTDSNTWKKFYKWPTRIAFASSFLVWTIIAILVYRLNPQPVTMFKILVFIMALRLIDMANVLIAFRIRQGLVSDNVIKFAVGRFNSIDDFNKWVEATPPDKFDKAVGDKNFKP